MPFNQLILVLLGGFIFVSQWRRTKYYTRRVDGHRLILFSAYAGVVFLLIALVIDTMLAEPFRGIVEIWRQHISYPHTGKTFIAFILGSTLWYPLNFFHSELTHIERVLLKLGGPFEILLANTMGRRLLVMLKVKNDNIYVGYINRNFNPTVNPASLEMTVVMRGYSDKDTKEEVFDRFYLTPDELKMHALPFETLTVALPVSEVESAHLFNAAEYASRFEQLLRSETTVEWPPERPSYENFSAEDHFQLGQQYLHQRDIDIAHEQFIQAAFKDPINAKYQFFLAVVRALEIILGHDYRVIDYAANKQAFAWYVQAAKDYRGPNAGWRILKLDKIRDFDLEYFETANVFELLVHALIANPGKYQDTVQFILELAEKAQKDHPDTQWFKRSEDNPFTNEEMNEIETQAKRSLINVIYSCLHLTGNDPRYYQFVALVLAKTDRVVEIDLLAETLIHKGEWKAAEAVYLLPLKYNENEHLRVCLARIKERQFPLEQI